MSKEFWLMCLCLTVVVSQPAHGQEEFKQKKDLEVLIFCAENDRIEGVKEALRQGVDINGFDPHSDKSPLMGATLWERREVVEFLLENGADPNAKNKIGIGATIMATAIKRPDLFETLLDYGADVSEMNINSYMTIYKAASGKCENVLYRRVMKSVLEMGARQFVVYKTFPEYNSRKRETTPIMLASMKDTLEVVKLLWANGADITVRDVKDETALHYAYRSGSENLGIMEFLLKVGADVNAANDGGSTAMHYAAMNGDMEQIKILIKYGGLVDTKNTYGGTPLVLAISDSDSGKKYLDAIGFFIKSGADVNSRQDDGMTPLMTAGDSRNTPVEVAKLLVELGADIRLKDKDGKTALDHSRDGGNVGISRFLRSLMNKKEKR